MAKKRGNNEGSIYRRKDGRWVGQYLVYTSEGPKYRYLYGKTRGDVSRRLTKAMADRDGGLVFDAGNLTVGDYLDRWLSDSVRDTVRENTFIRYEGIVRLHLKPALGRVKLKALTPAHVRALYREKLDTGLSGRSVNYVHVTLHKALKAAVADGLIPRNATEGVKSPSPRRREEIRAMTPAEVRALFEAARGTATRPSTCWP